jgi:altered-inheritance-of-mitochondria protein 13
VHSHQLHKQKLNIVSHGCFTIKTGQRTGVLQPGAYSGRHFQSNGVHPQLTLEEIPQVSPALANQLSDATLSPDVSPARQAALDAGVRAKINAESARLHEGDDVLRQEIEAALERENLDRERSMTGDVDEHGDVKNSIALLGDLEEVDRYRTRASLSEHPEVKQASEAVASCYQCVSIYLYVMSTRVTSPKVRTQQRL